MRLDDQGVALEGGRELDQESFLAFLTARPQQLMDLLQRERVERLLRRGA